MDGLRLSLGTSLLRRHGGKIGIASGHRRPPSRKERISNPRPLVITHQNARCWKSAVRVLPLHWPERRWPRGISERSLPGQQRTGVRIVTGFPVKISVKKWISGWQVESPCISVASWRDTPMPDWLVCASEPFGFPKNQPEQMSGGQR